MRRKWLGSSGPRIGLAYAGYVWNLARKHRQLVDYVEIPFERLRHEPKAAEVVALLPAILHCASLSVAGLVRPPASTIAEVRHWAAELRTPWVGEHLAFVVAPSDSGPIDIGYTVAPPLNSECLARVVENCAAAGRSIRMPLILENPPQYFDTPGSTMDQPTFISALCEACEVDLLLDLSHLLITASNTCADPIDMLRRIPLERVREVHLSGIYFENHVAWDDHGARAPMEAFAMLEYVFQNARPQAVTLEYNWAGHFDEDEVVNDLRRVRQIASACVR